MIRALFFQATVGASENGVMTSELLEWLFSGKTGEEVKTKVSSASTPCQCQSISQRTLQYVKAFVLHRRRRKKHNFSEYSRYMVNHKSRVEKDIF